jgi:hypothetical protein
MNLVADQCSRCGKIVVKRYLSDSSDMVKTCDSFVYMCDTKPGETGRPSLQLKNYTGGDESQMYCLDCLLETVREWVETMKQRGSSDIPFKHIILAKGYVSSPCPVCGR